MILSYVGLDQIKIKPKHQLCCIGLDTNPCQCCLSHIHIYIHTERWYSINSFITINQAYICGDYNQRKALLECIGNSLMGCSCSLYSMSWNTGFLRSRYFSLHWGSNYQEGTHLWGCSEYSSSNRARLFPESKVTCKLGVLLKMIKQSALTCTQKNKAFRANPLI